MSNPTPITEPPEPRITYCPTVVGGMAKLRLNLDLFAEHGITLVENPYDADYLIAQSTVMFPSWAEKTIILCREPPSNDAKAIVYAHLRKFKLAVVHDPDKTQPNQRPFSLTDEAQFWPYRCDGIPITRSETTLRDRGVFFAGRMSCPVVKHTFANVKPLTHIRRPLAQHLLTEFPKSIIMGDDWAGPSPRAKSWHREKLGLIYSSTADFVLALESHIIPNYITEKLWDGFYSDRVTLYLGDPRIEHHVPTNCFLDLRPYYDAITGKLDVVGVSNRIRNMTQVEYDQIIAHMRVFRSLAEEKYTHLQDALTLELIAWMKQEYKPKVSTCFRWLGNLLGRIKPSPTQAGLLPIPPA